MESEIPQKVLKKASQLISEFGNNLYHAGDIEGREVYEFAFPPDLVLGYPFYFLYDRTNDEVEQVFGIESLGIGDLLIL